MTNLIEAIVESVSNGSITKETATELIGVVTESTALQRNAENKWKELRKKVDDSEIKLEKYKKLLKTASTDSEKERIQKLVDKYSAEYEKYCKDCADVMSKPEFKTKMYGRWVAHDIQHGNKIGSEIVDKPGGMKAKKELKDKYYSKGEDKLANKKPGRYLESSILDLYEAVYEKEINGEISSEEREMLIERLDEKFM